MTEPLDPHLIDRYLAGEATPGELATIEAQRQADPAWAAALDALAAEFARQPTTRWKTDAAWSRIQPAIGNGGAPVRRIPRISHTASRSAPASQWLIAAALLLAVGATTWRVATRGRGPNLDATKLANEIVTPNGARNTLTLGDGSRVTLNAGSRLRWNNDFGARTRDVYLDGEAYFVVTHDAPRPFRVHARGAIAHDLGTRFTVRAYPELPQLEVVVAEGSVSLRHDRGEAPDSAVLGAGQLARLGASWPPTIESNVVVERWTAWTNGSLVLEGLTLKEALPQLERWYDAKITLADPRLAERRLTARFHDETLPQMLDALTLALGAKWEQHGRSILLTSATQ